MILYCIKFTYWYSWKFDGNSDMLENNTKIRFLLLLGANHYDYRKWTILDYVRNQNWQILVFIFRILLTRNQKVGK